MKKPWTRWLLLLQSLLLLAMLFGMVANKFELLAFKPAFMTFVYAFQTLMVLTGLSLLVCGLVWWKGWQQEKVFAKWSLIMGVVPVIAVFALIGAGLKVPAIHNITTDLDNPPEFEASYKMRVEGLNSLDVPSAEVRELQRGYYSDLAPLNLPTTPDETYQRALQVVNSLGWTLVSSKPGDLKIEAYEETTFFGFKDDVVIRIQAAEQGSRVDVRSVSRVGRSDLGANAKRIQRFLDRMTSQ